MSASIQLDRDTDPLFRLIRQGACVLIEIIRGQAAVATNGACVEFRNERLDTAGVAHSVINIRAAGREVRVTVINGEVQMSRPGAVTLRMNEEYVATEGGRWQVRQITPAEAAGSGAWTGTTSAPRRGSSSRTTRFRRSSPSALAPFL